MYKNWDTLKPSNIVCLYISQYLTLDFVYPRFLQEKEDHILSLESSISRLGAEAGDKASLLESVQSDKTALSRALTQNKDLKRQLAELQNGFVKLVHLSNSAF